MERMLSDLKYGMTEDEKKERTDKYIEEVYILSKCTLFAETKKRWKFGRNVLNEGKYKDVYFFEDLNKSRLY